MSVTLRVVAMLVVVAYPTLGFGQAFPVEASGPGTWLVPTIRVARMREDNTLFGVAPSAATFTRVSPSLELRSLTPRHAVQGSYNVDSDRYGSRLRVLNTTVARQLGSLVVDSKLSPRTSLLARGRYVATVRPEDVLDNTGLLQERRIASLISGEAGIERLVTARLRARASYAIAADDFGAPIEDRPSAESTFHAVTAGGSYALSPRSTLGVEYTGRLLYGKDLRTTSIINGRFGASVVAARFTHLVTPRLSLTLLGGARLSQTLPAAIPVSGSAPLRTLREPELLASLSYRRGETRTSATYTRSQFTGFGAAGFIDTETVEARATARLFQRVLLSARPVAYRNTLGSLQARVYRLDAAGAVRTWKWVHIEAGYGYRSQNRSLTLADAIGGSRLRPRVRNSLTLGIAVQQALRLD